MRRAAPVLVLLLVLISGCAGPVSDSGGTDTPTVTPAPTPTPIPPTATDTPDAPATETEVRVVDYADLSPAARAAFDAAVEGQAKFLPDSPHVEGEYFEPDVAGEFRHAEYVHTGEETYALSWSFGELYASYGLYAEAASPGDDAAVVDHADLSPNVSTQVRWAIENGSHHVQLGKWHSFHPDLEDVEYVRYEGETYRMRYDVGDYRVLVLETHRT